MIEFFATVVIFSLAMAGLSIGMFFGRAGIKGHCGGAAASLPDQCVKDQFGNKLEPCGHCTCE